MRTAKQQAEDLDQAGSFLNAMLTSNGELPKMQSPVKEPSHHHQRQSNGRSKSLKVDHVNRFADPPAPPPQQPLPEKPDSSKMSPVNSNSFTNLLKRNDTTKPNNVTHSPTNPQNSQMLSLIEALSIAKKELDSQGTRVKQLEDMLKEERSAREDAEERARKLEQHVSARPVLQVEEEQQEVPHAEPKVSTLENVQEVSIEHDELSSKERQLKENLENVVAEMQKLKVDMDQFQRRAEVAEADATKARASLAEMIDKIREENEKAEAGGAQSDEREFAHEIGKAVKASATEEDREIKPLTKWPPHANGHLRAPKLPENLERAVATVLKDRNGNVDSFAQSAPYVSMLGVVLIGVGLMAYLNSWQKGEK